MPKKKGDKKKLAPVDKEVIYRTYLATDNKTDTARRCNVSLGSVQNVIKEFEGRDPDKPQLPAVKAKRAEIAAEVAGRIHNKADMVLDSITKEDMDSGRIPRHDADGNIIGYTQYGPSAVQKATTFGILKDKETQAYKLEQEMLQDTQSGQLMLPSGLKEMAAQANRMIKELRIIDVKFADENQELLTSAQEVIAEAITVEEERPDVVSIDEFDNPK
jgi:hypothetical protein